MPSSGPNACGTGADDSAVGTIAWTNPGNITADDASYAVATLGASDTSHYIVATNFGFSIPSTSTVNGIEVFVKKNCTGSVKDVEAYLYRAGSVIGTNNNHGGAWPSPTDGTVTYGGSSDLWGTAVTPTDINDSGFGYALSCVDDGGLGSTARVNYVQMTVYYTEDTGPNRSQVRIAYLEPHFCQIHQ